jgi:DNA-binding winged helix-turn-helix (wHTH) protein/tetratricopeptide (TPR) repeat protein/TolB-like protein
MGNVVASTKVFRFGLFEADAARNTLTRNGVRVKIQDQPFRVLVALLELPGEVIPREELRQKLWPEGTYVDFDGSLNVILKKLRSAIDDDSENPRFIETVPRRGYRFIAPVAVSSVNREPSASGSSVEVHSSTGTQATVKSSPLPARRSWSHLAFIASASAVLIAIGMGWLGWHRRQFVIEARNSDPLKSAPVRLRKSVAVLGFHNVSGRVADAWLSTAFSEMLSTELAAGQRLRLVSGEDVANLRLSSPWSQTDTLDHETTARIGSALNSDLLVLGSYTTQGQTDRGQVRLDVRLQEARTGEILSEVAEIGGAQDLFHLVSRVGSELRDRLGVGGLDDPDQASVLASLPENREATRFYSLGVAKLRQFDALAAKDLLQQACIADPKFSLAHLMLARAWSQLGYEQKRKDEAKKALDLSTDLPRVEQLVVQGDYYASLADHEKAASTYRVLVQLFPDSVEYGLLLANAQVAGSHASQAAETIAQLRRLPKPASDDPLIDLADIRATAKNDPDRLVLIRSAMRKAEAQGKKLVYAQARKEECLNLNYSDHPSQGRPACEDAYNLFLAAGNRLGAADAVRLMADFEGSQGHMEQAIATYKRALTMLDQLGEHSKTGAVLNNMAINFANQGKLDRAEQLYRQAKFHFEQAGDKGNTAMALGNIADILYLRGDLPAAEKMYEQALDIDNSLDRSSPGYLDFRLADLKLTQGHVQDAHRLAQLGVDSFRANQGGYGYLSEGLIEMGEVLKAEGNLQGARQQFESARDVVQKAGDQGLVQESQAELADLAAEEGRGDQAESLIRPAIAEFEQEKSDPASSGAYTVLSHALLLQGKLPEARNAAQRATELSLTSSDPALKLPAAIQHARVEIASAGPGASAASGPLAAARLELRAVVATAKKLGYYQLECEARILLGELEVKISPVTGRSQLNTLASETRRRGLELLARNAEQALSGSATVMAVNRPTP